MKKIIFLSINKSSFIENDFNILKKHFKVKRFDIKSTKGLQLIVLNIQYLFILIPYMLRGYKTVYVWFADYHSFLPIFLCKIFRGKSIVVVGGYDVQNIPSLNYGSHMSSFRSFITKRIFKSASVLLPVSMFVKSKLINTYNASVKRTILIYNGVKINSFNEMNSDRKGFVTICSGSDENRYLIKGIDRFLELANELNSESFTIVGPTGDLLKLIRMNKPENVEVLPPIGHHMIPKFLSKHKYICQFSRSEAFGLALIEGIMTGCIPLVSNVGGLPEVVDHNSNFIIDFSKEYDFKDFVNDLSLSHKINMHLRETRSNIMMKFSLAKREMDLVGIIKKISE